MKQLQAVQVLSPAAVVLALVALVGPTGCRSDAGKPEQEGPDQPAAASKARESAALEVTSTAFADGGPIPEKYTADGEDISPPLAWSGVPQGTKELALVCDDPDAPTPEPWVHWVIYKIPAGTKELPEGIAKTQRPQNPAGALQGKNSWKAGQTIGYRGPSPPPGHGTHHYHFTLYALDEELAAEPALDKRSLLKAIAGHILAEGRLTGTYKR